MKNGHTYLTSRYFEVKNQDFPYVTFMNINTGNDAEKHDLLREVPWVSAEKRLEVISLEQGFFQVTVNYGFMQSLNVPAALRGCESCGLKVNLDSTTFYLARETMIPYLKRPGMMLWREKLFSFMARKALPATDFFKIPPERVVELGIQIEL